MSSVVLVYDVGLKSKSNVTWYSHNICVMPLPIYLLYYCEYQGLSKGEIDGYYSSLLVYRVNPSTVNTGSSSKASS